jgi:hypothetical protein
MKRRPREIHLGVRKGGRGAGGADRGEGGAPAVVLRRRRCRGEVELRGAVWFEGGARGFLYRAERGAEGALLRWWAARSVVAGH